MPKIIVNYKFDKRTKKLILGGKIVYADKPLCLIELDEDYIDPILVTIPNGLPIIIEKEEFDMSIKEKSEVEKRDFYFKIDGSRLVEVSQEEFKPNHADYLHEVMPINTKLESLFFENGHINTIEEEKECD